MEGTQLFHTHSWQPLEFFNITHPLLAINKETVINTWLVLIVIGVLIGLARILLHHKSGVGRFLVITYVKSFMDLTKQTMGTFHAHHFYFIAGLFTFLVVCNTIAVIPWTEEPTKDINTTLAMGIISFLYIQWYSIKAHGLGSYIKEYFSPFFVMFPLHVIGKVSSIISLSFRLFGNIFGGSVIAGIFLHAIRGSLLLESAGLFLGINLAIVAFFILFEGILQAFVFAMLTLTYLAIAIADQEPTVGDLP